MMQKCISTPPTLIYTWDAMDTPVYWFALVSYNSQLVIKWLASSRSAVGLQTNGLINGRDLPC